MKMEILESKPTWFSHPFHVELKVYFQNWSRISGMELGDVNSATSFVEQMYFLRRKIMDVWTDMNGAHLTHLQQNNCILIHNAVFQI